MWPTISSSYVQQKALVTFELKQVATEEVIVQPKFALFFQDSIAVPFQEFAANVWKSDRLLFPKGIMAVR